MARKPFLMRASSGVMAAVERLAAAELRSVNAQVECLLREALKQRGVKLDSPKPVRRGRPPKESE